MQGIRPLVNLHHVRCRLVQVRVIVQRTLDLNDRWQDLVNFVVLELEEVTRVDHSLGDVHDTDRQGSLRIFALVPSLLRYHSLLRCLAVLQLIFFEENKSPLLVRTTV